MLRNLKNASVVCNIGHFDNEIETSYMRDEWFWEEIKPQVHRVFRDTKPDESPDLSSKNYIILLAEGRLVILVMQPVTQAELWMGHLQIRFSSDLFI